jgi:hypothetical protein
MFKREESKQKKAKKPKKLNVKVISESFNSMLLVGPGQIITKTWTVLNNSDFEWKPKELSIHAQNDVFKPQVIFRGIKPGRSATLSVKLMIP